LPDFSKVVSKLPNPEEKTEPIKFFELLSVVVIISFVLI